MISQGTTRLNAVMLAAVAGAIIAVWLPIAAEAQLNESPGVQHSSRGPSPVAHDGASHVIMHFGTMPINVALFSQASRDSTRPLIGAPSWWPDKTTHQNVAALAVAGVVTFGIVWVLPEEISKWDKSVPMSEYLRRAYTMPPVWDNDEFYWNYIIHPVSGMWVYLMERNHDRSPMRGFLLSTAASVGWEYGFEAFIERPSIQDLVFTSTIGSAMGELAWVATKAMKKDGFTFLESIAITVINPAYVVNNGYR